MTNRAAANRYARALLEVALREKADLDAVEQQLADIVELFKTQPPVESVLVNPAVPVGRKRGAMVEIAARSRMQPIVAKLLVLLAERDRLTLVSDLLEAYRDRLLEYRKVVRAEVTTATPLSEKRVTAIQEKLARMTGRTVMLTARVDPAIVGGVVTRIGSTIYDGSITRQLARMKQTLGESA
jgi:F-type H+-transporting ATPase subunit delta